MRSISVSIMYLIAVFGFMLLQHSNGYSSSSSSSESLSTHPNKLSPSAAAAAARDGNSRRKRGRQNHRGHVSSSSRSLLMDDSTSTNNNTSLDYWLEDIETLSQMNVTSITIEMNQWIRNSIQNCQISYSSPATSSSSSSPSDSLNNDNDDDNDGWMINEPFHYMNSNNHRYSDDENTLCIQSAANKAEAVLRWMRRFSIEENRPNLKPNLVTYNTVLNAHAKAGNPRAACDIVELMREEDGIEPDLHTYAGLIQAWSRSKKGRDGAVEAEKVFEEMLSSSKSIPNEVVLGALVDAWAKSGEMDAGEQAERVLLANDGIVASTVTFNSVMDAYAKRGKAKDAQRILKLMIATKYVTPNTRSYNILMQAWTRASNDRVQTAELLENFLLTMLTSQTNNVPVPDEVTFTIVIHAWAKSGAGLKAARSAVRLLNSMVDHKIKPNMKTWASVVDCWAKVRDRNHLFFDFHGISLPFSNIT